ncbi:MAG TPA: hypothetical protein VJ739_14380, partial [Gemmataceae bacterium]|nr:hypothetical protein [Gemmataceae bacterium]
MKVVEPRPCRTVPGWPRRVLRSDALWAALVGIPVAALLTARGPLLTADTNSYLGYSIFRDPLTPLFLGALRAAAGAGFLRAAVFLQVALTFWATSQL